MRVYLAGALRGKSVIEYIQNCYKMIKTGSELIKKGYAVYIPCIDFLTGLVSGNFEWNDYFHVSAEFLKVCDCVLVMPEFEQSEGVAKEIALAQSLNIPIYYNKMQLFESHIC